MRSASAVLSFILFAGLWLALHACTLLTAPVATAVIGGAQLAIKGAELQKEIRKADAQAAVNASFDETWDVSFTALANLDIAVTRSERNVQEDGGVIEASAGKTKVRLVVVKVTEKITEIGIWASHDKALAGLVVEKVRQEREGGEK